MRVLVVEDHPRLAQTVAKVLRREGMAVDVAFDGREVIFGPGFEHSVVVVQATADQVRVYDPEPDVGPHWLSRADFEASYHVFGEMAVVLS